MVRRRPGDVETRRGGVGGQACRLKGIAGARFVNRDIAKGGDSRDCRHAGECPGEAPVAGGIGVYRQSDSVCSRIDEVPAAILDLHLDGGRIGHPGRRIGRLHVEGELGGRPQHDIKGRRCVRGQARGAGNECIAGAQLVNRDIAEGGHAVYRRYGKGPGGGTTTGIGAYGERDGVYSRSDQGVRSIAHLHLDGRRVGLPPACIGGLDGKDHLGRPLHDIEGRRGGAGEDTRGGR